ncbi:hypothetical protein JTB14_019056 [Gonioctena quinquepunctata]|nr:hypothetical protein JTB14_019056 [Gonioctena quinquepunctata]
MGFPINRDFLIHSVKQLVEAEGMNNPFKDNVPGRKWFEGFLKRHPRVGQKKAEHPCKARAVVSESGIRSWFSHVAEELGENIETLKDPRRVFDIDETAIHLAPEGGLVLAERGKSIFYDVADNEKENSGFKASGICPFDADAVDYTKCIEIKEPQNAQNISNEPESQKSAQVLSHRQFVESKIDSDVLQRFKHAKAAGIAWEADDKYELLYDLWVKAIEDDTNADNDQQSPSCLASEDINPSITNDDIVMEFEFPEFSELNFDEVEEPLESFISHSPNRNPDFGVPLSPEPSIPSDINTDSNTIRAVIPSNAVSTLSTENVSNSNTMTMRRKALDEVINQIFMWPKKQPSKRKRAVEHLPPVITSEKWIEVMEAEENERNEKEEEKKLKKIEREERIEKNKRIKQEKLEEQAEKKQLKN